MVDLRERPGRSPTKGVLGSELDPGDVLVFEDTEAGIASARGAGMRVVAVRGTLVPERLAQAEEIVDRVDLDVMRRYLS